MLLQVLDLVHTVRFFLIATAIFFYRNKWVVQDSMEVFTLFDCDNLIHSYAAHYKQQQIVVAIIIKRTVWIGL